MRPIRSVFAMIVGIASPAAMAQTAPPSIDWPTAAFDSARTGSNPHETAITPANVGSLAQAWSVSVDGGAIIAEPIVAAGIATGSGLRDLAVVGTEAGTIAALDATTGLPIWSHNTGYSQTKCADLPLSRFGISAAAAFDRPSNRIYAMGGDGKMYAYVAGTGAIIAGWPVTILPNRDLEHVYGGLNISQGSVYVTTASMCDGSVYHGRVLQVAIASATVVSRLWMDGTVSDANGKITQPGPDGGGVWGPAGVAIEANGSYVYTATGNIKGAGPDNRLYGNHVLKMTPSLGVVASTAPPLGCTGCDLDFGSSPVLLQPPGCGPRLAVLNKNRRVYIFRRSPFVTTALQVLPNNDVVGDVAYDLPTNRLIAANLDGVRAYTFNHCAPAVAWNTAETSGPGGTIGGAVSPPSIANGVVYYGNGAGGVLHALNATTGQQLLSYPLGGWSFAQPTVVNGTVFVPTWDGRITALKPAVGP